MTMEEGNVSTLIAARPGPLRLGLWAMLNLMPQIENVIQVSDASLVPSAIKRHSPVLVLLDGSLLCDGVASVLRMIKEDGYQGRCLVLANDVRQQREAKSAGADMALVKGFPAGILFEVVERLLEKGLEIVGDRG